LNLLSFRDLKDKVDRYPSGMCWVYIWGKRHEIAVYSPKQHMGMK